MSLLKMTMIGNLGKDAEIKDFGNRSVISFTVAHTEKVTDRTTNSQIEKTTWVSCSYWRESDKTSIAQYLKKGTQVYLEGNPSVRTYQNREGITVGSLELNVRELQLLGIRNQNNNPAGGENMQNYANAGGQYGSSNNQSSSYSNSGSNKPSNEAEPASQGNSGSMMDDDLPF
jgi:single-strand DNA-binding protein